LKGLIIGLTGSSGSGKSEAAKILAKLGAAVIDADKTARRVTDGKEALDELKSAFGGWIIDGSGAYNRAQASRRAFSDKAFLKRLTEITHRHIIKEIYRLTEELLSQNYNEGARRVVVIDAPLPVEKGFLDLADAVWVVRSAYARRLGRVVARDGLSAGEAEARFSSQMSDDDYARLADVVIDNDGSLDELERAVARHYESFLKNAGRHSAAGAESRGTQKAEA